MKLYRKNDYNGKVKIGPVIKKIIVILSGGAICLNIYASTITDNYINNLTNVPNLKIVGHRGDINDGEYIENTYDAIIESFTNTNSVVISELDLQLTKDNELVVYHDEYIGRLEGNPLWILGLTKRVDEVSISEMNNNRKGIEFTSLNNILDTILLFKSNGVLGEQKLLIELKNKLGSNDNMDLILLELLKKDEYRDILENIQFQTDNMVFAKNIKGQFPDNELILVVRSQEEIVYLNSLTEKDQLFTGVNIGIKFIDDDILELLYEQQYDLFIYTINKNSQIKKLLSFNINTNEVYVVTDKEEAIIKIIDRLKQTKKTKTIY